MRDLGISYFELLELALASDAFAAWTALSTASALFSAEFIMASVVLSVVACMLSVTFSALSITFWPSSVCLLHAPRARTAKPIVAALMMSFINFPLYCHPHK